MRRILLIILAFFVTIVSVGQIGFEQHYILNDNSSKYTKDTFAIDLDGDGDMDVLSASTQDDKIAWYENLDGQGTFSTQKIISTTAVNANNVFAIDIDGDGDNDVLSSSNGNNLIAWYENLDGLGNFSPPIIISDSVYSASDVYAADIDGDGDFDVLSASNHRIYLHENLDGQGTFAPKFQITAFPGKPKDIICADLDNDNDLDLIAGSYSDGTLAWYENDGLGNFGSEQEISTGIFLGRIRSVQVGDFNNDGNIDIITAGTTKVDANNYVTNRVYWYRNFGNGTFLSGVLISDQEAGSNAVYPIDVDNDGDLDIVCASFHDANVWYENDGSGYFSTNQFGQGWGDESAFPIDINNDGIMEVVGATGEHIDNIFIYKSTTGIGSFDEKKPITTQYQLSDSLIKECDIDGDGDMDLLTTLSDDFFEGIFWLKNMDGLGKFGVEYIETDSSPVSVYPVDIDNDGDKDILVELDGANGNYLSWSENTNSLGSFAPLESLNIYGFYYNTINEVKDVDSDGDIDIIINNDWYENDGTGVFLQANEIITEYNHPMKMVDIDGDGDYDIIAQHAIASYYTNKQMVWYENDGTNNYGTRNIISNTYRSVNELITADYDNDGDMDFAILDYKNGDKIVWYENTDGLGTYLESQEISSFTTNYNILSIVNLDIDNDGDIDIVSTQNNGDTVYYENTDGLGVFANPQTIHSNERLDKVTISDVDGDGDKDILGATSFSSWSGTGKMFWLENNNQIKNEISGYVRLDIDSNGCADNRIIPNTLITTTNGIDTLGTFTLSNGFYQFIPEVDTYTTSVVSIPTFYQSNPSSYSTTFTDTGNTFTANFCIEAIEPINDLNIVLLPTGDARPGFDTQYQLVIENVGTTILSDILTLEFDNTKLVFLNASETSNLTNNILSIPFNDLEPFETRTIDVNFNILPPPVTNINDELTFIATIPSDNDQTPDDNIFHYNQIIIGSYDPNDITVLEGDYISYENNLDDYLHYIIRFQNTGTTHAIKVRIHNVLDSKLDWTTLKLVSSSHNNYVEIKNGNEIDFIFNAIYLPDSTHDEPNSHGFLSYKIKPKNDVVIGDVIQNTADIFFDYNQPVITNTVTTEFISTLGITNFGIIDFTITPNPAQKLIKINSKFKLSKLELYNKIGQIIISINNSNKLEISNLNSGIYFCKITDIYNNVGVQKLIIN